MNETYFLINICKHKSKKISALHFQIPKLIKFLFRFSPTFSEQLSKNKQEKKTKQKALSSFIYESTIQNQDDSLVLKWGMFGILNENQAGYRNQQEQELL